MKVALGTSGAAMNWQLRSMLVLGAVMALSVSGFSADASSLKPPPGAKVAIVMFEDMECPQCARTFPMVHEVGKAHKVPVVFYDFPLPSHAWSFNAAVYARFFETKSAKLGDDFRAYIFQNQPQIIPGNLQQYVQKFADENKVPLPFAIDPQGKLKEAVEADRALGTRCGLQHTPTIFVIGSSGASTPFVEVEDTSQLSQIVEDMQSKAAAAAPAHRATTKPHKGPVAASKY
jgi:protein-disulfide isomerase